MSVYIEGMEMQTEGTMIFAIRPDGMVEDVMGCYIGKAIPVPDHGRLGDLDKLYKEALKRSETKDGYYNCLDPVISCYTIDHAPTIIPSSGCKNDG